MSGRFALLLSVAVTGGLRAQAPAAAPVERLPPRNDTTYALRIDPADYPGHDYVLLLEDGWLRVEADGRATYTIRQVAQILTPVGAEDWGEISLWHTPERQVARINWMRVVDRDGNVLTDRPAHQQEMSRPAEPASPVFSDRRALQATAAGIAPGTIVDYSSTIEVVRPWLPGDFLYYWTLNGQTPVRRSRFVVDAPADMNVRVREKNLSFDRVDVVVGGRRVRRWVTTELPAVVEESFAAAENDVMMWVAVSGPVSWRDIGAWYGELTRGQPGLTPAIVAAHAAQLRGAKTQDDSMRATYRWVTQDFRYVSLSLGDGGYRPRQPKDVYDTRFGDCKDKATLFVSLARQMGLTAYPVLVHLEGGVDSLLPSLDHFDHMLAAVVRSGETQYLDVTADLTPYGELPAGLQGEVGVALTARGAQVVVLPAATPEQNRFHQETAGALGRDGRFVGHITVSAAGTEQYGLRETFANIRQQDAKTRDETLRRYALSVFSSATVDSARYNEGRDLAIPASVTVWFSATNVVGTVGDKYYFNLPLPKYTDANVVSRVEAEERRRFAIDVAEVNSPSVYRSALDIQLPEGWRAEVPTGVSVDGPFGYYRAAYRQAGRTFTASREMGGRRGVLPPDSAAALRGWFKAVAGDRTTMIVLSRGTGLPRIAAGAPDAPRPDAGAVAGVVLRLDDLPAEAKLAREGAIDDSQLILGLTSAPPLDSYQRDFGADQLVFTAGRTRIVALQAAAAVFRTRAEASRAHDMLSLFDIPSLFATTLGQVAAAQATLGESRSIDAAKVGDRSSGWVVQMVTPLATFDLAILIATRGRVATSIFAVGPAGMRDEDLVGLIGAMDERVRRSDAYGADVASAGSPLADVRAADSALAVHSNVPLNDIAAFRADDAAATYQTARFEWGGGRQAYTAEAEGRGYTFPLGAGAAISVTTTVTLHGSEAQALKYVIDAETRSPQQQLRLLVREMGELAALFVGGGDTTVRVIAGPRVGARSVTLAAKLRRMVRMDMDYVVFARGRMSAAVVVAWPPDRGDRAAAGAVARRVLQQMARAVPSDREAAPPARLVDAVRRVVAAEHTVDSLVDARDFDAAFRVIDRAKLSSAPVSFEAGTWNSVCWWASLYGNAGRARPACDAAVAPDTTNISFRDSRGLARALTGDLAGAKDDFTYVVENSTRSTFVTERAGWLEALKNGTNPFTTQVLEKLREQ